MGKHCSPAIKTMPGNKGKNPKKTRTQGYKPKKMKQ